jgi:hypothetical protein
MIHNGIKQSGIFKRPSSHLLRRVRWFILNASTTALGCPRTGCFAEQAVYFPIKTCPIQWMEEVLHHQTDGETPKK